MDTSIVDSTIDSLYGMPWGAIFRLRDTLAHKAYYRHNETIPLSEFQSAGNLAITEAAQTYTIRETSPASFRSYLAHALVSRMASVWRQEHKSRLRWTLGTDGHYHPHRLPIRHVDATVVPLPTTTPYERHHDASRLLDQLDALPTTDQTALLQWAQGQTYQTIGQAHGVCASIVMKRVRRGLRTLQGWAYQGLPEDPPTIRRTQHPLTPTDHATIRRLHHEGVPQKAIASRVGCAVNVVKRVLRHRENQGRTPEHPSPSRACAPTA